MPNTYSGIYEALVHDLSDPQGQGRARLRIPSVLGQAMSAWARPALGKTDHVPASIGDRVWAMFEHGDLGRPVWFSPVQPLFNKSNPPVEQLHSNPSFDLTFLSTHGSVNTGPVSSRAVPAQWHWGWSWPQDPLAYPRLESDGSATREGTGRSLRVSWDAGPGVHQYLWTPGFAAPAGSVVKVSTWFQSSDPLITASVGVLSANTPNPNVLSTGNVSAFSVSTTSVGEWTKISRSMVIPEGHSYASLHIIVGNGGVGGSVWLDDTESSFETSGGVGSGVEEITINFATPSSLWTLEHNLGKRFVDVRTMDSAGEKIVGDITFVDENTATVEWFFPTTGIAHITTG